MARRCAEGQWRQEDRVQENLGARREREKEEPLEVLEET
jgi:hypothetical protein